MLKLGHRSRRGSILRSLALGFFICLQTHAQPGAFLASGDVINVAGTFTLVCRNTTVAVLDISPGQVLSTGSAVLLLEPLRTESKGLPVFRVREQHARSTLQPLGRSGTWNPSIYQGPRAPWCSVNWSGTAKKKAGVDLPAPLTGRVGTALPSPTLLHATSTETEAENATPGLFSNENEPSAGVVPVALSADSNILPTELTITGRSTSLVVRLSARVGARFTLSANSDADGKFEPIATGEIPATGWVELPISATDSHKFFTVSLNAN